MENENRKGVRKIKAERCLESVKIESISNIGVVGGRSLPPSYATQISDIVEYLLNKGYHIASGGAKGADAYVLSHLVEHDACDKGVVFSAWNNFKVFPVAVRENMRQFCAQQGSLIWGDSSGKDHPAAIKIALLHRNIKLVQASEGIVAFLTEGSRGTFFTIQEAIKKRKKLVVFPVGRALPQFKVVKWVPLTCGGCWENSYKAVYLR